MGYSEREWQFYGGSGNYNKGKISGEIKVFDETGLKIDTLRWNNLERFRNCLETLRIKYNLTYSKEKEIPKKVVVSP